MNHQSLSVYTPRVRHVRYDSLEPDAGARKVTLTENDGTRAHNLLAFTSGRIAWASDNPVFSLDPMVSSFLGPAFLSGFPFSTTYTLWVASAGLRMAEIGNVVRPNNVLGAPAQVYPASTFPKISGAYGLGLVVVAAVQKTATTIEVAYETAETYSWTGSSPLLYLTNLIHSGGEARYEDGLACIYLRADQPESIFARFEVEEYATEHILVADFMTDLESLVAVREESGALVLYARDTGGRYVTLTTDPYVAEAGAPEAVSSSIAFTGGSIAQSTAPLVIGSGTEDPYGATVGENSKSLSIAFTGGSVSLVAQAVPALDPEAVSFSIAFTGGEVF